MGLYEFNRVFPTDKFANWAFDAGNGQGHGYVDSCYDEICGPMRNSATAILELGVHNGYSHLLWSAFFQKANIYGCDWVYNPYPDHNRIHLIGEDAYSLDTVEYYRQKEPKGYDLIIDDGSHLPQHQEFFIRNYWSLVKPNKYMVVEDVVGDEAAQHLIQIAIQHGGIKVVESRVTTLNVTLRAIVIRKI